MKGFILGYQNTKGNQDFALTPYLGLVFSKPSKSIGLL